MIRIDNVNFSYNEEEKKRNLNGIDLEIHKGECVLLCGSSGCGKTTITKLINGLIPHFDDGKLEGITTVDGLKVEDTPLYELSQKVGSVFQNPKSQFFNIDSDSELAFGLENNGVEPKIIEERTEQVTKELDIEHLLNRNVFSMSGGEKQTLAFASVYAMNPDVYVLDEPSANLDREATDNLRVQIQTIKAQGKTIIVAEHRLYYLRDLIDRAILIENGEISKEFTKEEFSSLSEEERHSMGLRTIEDQDCMIEENPPVSGTLEIRDLSVRIKKHMIFEHVSFAAEQGKVLGILGHNGAGKSTLLRCISGLQKECSGEILYNGRKLKRKERNRLCYMIMQDVNHQLFGESVWNECVISSSGDVNEEAISNALSDFDLLEYRDKHPMALSGGQKQRLAIVTGTVAGKKIILFDEPSSGLDYVHMKTVSDTLRKLAEDGNIVMVVTHDMELLNLSCDQVLRF